ncbi:MAG: DUF6600 domain-containing protein [Chthoniobacteraceae bacterium]|jgi:hypothetical protein
MKIPKLFLLAAAACLGFGAMCAPQARAQVSVSFFYDTLSPYGEWVQDPNYGVCWHPTGVDENWAPYTDGYWAYTDAGWTWVSYEDYGGVVYHYGRWAFVPGEGWVWVPGYTWAPAWVSWRTGGSYVGWAPLPPEARWSAGIGFSTWVDVRFGIGPGFYSFVSVGDFGAPALGGCILDRSRNVTIINQTTNITNITVNNSTVYTGGPSYAKYSALSKRPIPTLKLVRQTNASLVKSAGGKDLSRQEGNELMVIAPKVSSSAGGARPTPPKISKTLEDTKPDNGWSIVNDPTERSRLQADIKKQAGSNLTGSAKPIGSADVKLVTQKTKSKGTEKPLEAEESPTPKSSKGTKNKSLSTEELENAPAAEEQGSAKAEPTPKHKSKKAKTPSEEDSGAASDETPSKHSKESSDSNLQPFMSGDDSSKTKESSKYDSGESDKSGTQADEGKGSETEKSSKSKKKKSKQEESPSQG